MLCVCVFRYHINCLPLLFFVFSQFFHFYSVAYPPKEGHFKGRVIWHGDPGRGDASVRLLNATLNDNGTYSCAVRNPPDFQGPPSNTVLSVSLKSETCYKKQFIASIQFRARFRRYSFIYMN